MTAAQTYRSLAFSTALSGIALTLACGGGNSFCDQLQVALAPTAAYGNATIMAGNPLTVKPTVDSVGPIVSATLVSGSLPAGMTLLADGTIVGTPTTPGTYPVSVRLCNAAGGCTTVTDAITVTPGTLYEPETTTVGTPLTVTPVNPGEAITGATLSSGSLPAGMTLNGDGTITGTPTAAGVSTAVIRTCTAHGCSTGTAVITVNAPSATPLAASYANATGPVNQALGTVPTLPTGGPVTTAGLTSGVLPDGMILNGDGSISGTPSQVGAFPLLVTLGNASGGKVTVPVILTVTPANASPLDASYLAATTPVGTNLSVAPAVPTGGPVAGAALTSGTVPPGMALNPATGAISGTPTTPGTYTAEITLRNASGGAITKPAVITVTAGTQALDVSYTDTILPVGSFVSLVPTLTQGGPVTSATLVSGSLPPGLTLNSDGSITGVPTTPGTYTLQIQLCNGANGCETVPLTITTTLAVPVLVYPSPTTTVGTPLTLSPVNSGGALGASDSVSVLIGTLPDGMTLNPDTGLISGIPTTAGVYTLRVQACNISGCSTTQTIITVNDAAAQPLAASYTDASGVVGSPLSTLPVITEGGPVTSALLKGGTLPSGMLLNPATGAITGTPTVTGAFPLLVTLGNATSGKITVPVTLTISQVNATPLAAAYTNASTQVNSPLTVSPLVTAGGPATGATLATGSLPPGMGLNAVTGAITGIPTVAGTYPATITLTNASGAATTVPVVITVNTGTQALAVTYVDILGLVGAPLTITPTLASGGPVSSASLASGSLPPGMTLNQDGTLTGTPTIKGTYTLLIQLCNGAGGCTTQPLTITIDALALHYTTPVTYLTGSPIAPDLPHPTGGTSLTYSVTSGSLPDGLVLNSDGSISGTPTAATPGFVAVTVTGAVGAASASQVLSIQVVAAPTASLAANPSTVPVNQSSSLTAIFTGSLDGTAILSGGNLAAPLTVTSGTSIPTGVEGSPTSLTYTLTVSGALGLTATSQATVQWIPAPADIWTVGIPTTGGGPFTPGGGNELIGQISITVPDQGQATCGTVSLTVNKEEALPGSLATGVHNYSTTFNISSSQGYPFRAPVSVTLAYDPALSSPNLGANDLPMPFYWDPSYNQWISTGFKSVDTTRHTVTFTTLLPGRYAVLGIPGLVPATKTLGFASATDDWRQNNPAVYDLPGGASLGMGSFASWYFPFRKITNGNTGLYNVFPTLADTSAQALISRLANGTLDSWSQVWDQNAYTLNDKQTGLALITGLTVTAQPQVFLMGDARPAIDNALATVVYGFDSNTGKFKVMDPNYPGNALNIAWNASTGLFSAYDRAAAYVPSLVKFAFEGQTSVHRLADFERVFSGAAAGFPASTFATLGVDQVGDVSSPDLGQTIAVTSPTSVVVSGTITNGDESATKLFWSQNGSAPRALVDLTPVDATHSSFTFTIPALVDPYGTTVALETTANPCDPTFSHSGFQSFKVKQAGIQPWFKDSCFENWQGSGVDWTIEQGLNYTGYFVASTPVVSGGELVGQNISWSLGLGQSVLEDVGGDDQIPAIQKVLSGTHSFRVNDGYGNNHAARARQTVTVPSTIPKPKLSFYWASVMQDIGHAPVDQPYVDILIQDMTNGGEVVLYKHFYAGDPNYPGWINAEGQPAVKADQVKGIPWQKMSYSVPDTRKGHQLRVTVTAADCTQGGHGGTAYLDNLGCE